MTTNKPEVFRFHCHGRSAPAYNCNKPADNSGEYVLLAEYEALQAENAAIKEENKRLKARVAELAAPAVQGEPVADLLIGEPEYTKQGWEPGDWDIEPNATTIEAFAKLAKPGAYQLYLAPQPAEQKPAQDVARLVAALEWLRGAINATPENDKVQAGAWISTSHPRIKQIDELLASHRKGDQP